MPLERFNKHKQTKDGRNTYCIFCNSRRNKKWYKANTKRAADSNRRAATIRRHGITVEQYDLMEIAQEGVCAICKLPESKTMIKAGTAVKCRLHIDHCHRTGKIRGLLCNNCNVSLGLLRDDSKRIANMLKYLEDNI